MSLIPPIWRLLKNSAGADFVHHAEISDNTFPVGTLARIVLYQPDKETVLDTWDGTLNGSVAFDFYAAAADTAVLPDRVHYRCYVEFPDVPSDFLWFYGTLARIG